jgi:phage terminase large subunit GpA-like protein
MAPNPDITGSEWANQYRILSSGARPGQFDVDVTPFNREPLDVVCGSDPAVTSVAMMKSSQVGYSELLNNAVARSIHLDPSEMILVQPTIDRAEEYSKERVHPMLKSCEVLAELTGETGEKKSKNTIDLKQFPGGFLAIIGANSPSALASRPVRRVFIDEYDRFKPSAGGPDGEGNPRKLLDARMITFFNRMLVMGGTPVHLGSSATAAAYEDSDQRLYYVPCPRCSELIKFSRSDLVMDPQDDNYGLMRCEACAGLIEDHEKHEMIKDVPMGGLARWVRTKPEASPEKAGFFIWSAYSPFLSFLDICENWNNAKGDVEEERVSCNTIFGLPYEHKTVNIAPETLMGTRENYTPTTVPNDVVLVTVGADAQNDRFELEAVGWGADEESWSLDYQTIDADPATHAARQELEDYLTETVFVREDGNRLPIRAAFIDSGGHRTDDVYNFTRGKANRHIYACKGSSVSAQPVFIRLSYQKKARLKIAMVGTDTAKESIYSRLGNPAETRGQMHFPLTRSLSYFEQLISEERKIRYVKGTAVVSYEKKKADKAQGKKGAVRNEPLDCRVYALAALRSLPLRLKNLVSRNERARREYQLKKNPGEAGKEASPKTAETPENEAKPAKKAPLLRRKRPTRRGWLSSK